MSADGGVRKDKLIQKRPHDAYQEKGKWPEPTVCTECGALYAHGRWTWKPAPEPSAKAVCPACRRIRGNQPAGRIVLSGDFYQEHRDDILRLLQNTAAKEKRQYPLERILAIRHEAGQTNVTTTGVHMARRLGEALRRAHHGDLKLHYLNGEKNVRVAWER